MGGFVGGLVGGFVGGSVGGFVGDLVGGSVGVSVGGFVGGLVGAAGVLPVDLPPPIILIPKDLARGRHYNNKRRRATTDKAMKCEREKNTHTHTHTQGELRRTSSELFQ